LNIEYYKILCGSAPLSELSWDVSPHTAAIVSRIFYFKDGLSRAETRRRREKKKIMTKFSAALREFISPFRSTPPQSCLGFSAQTARSGDEEFRLTRSSTEIMLRSKQDCEGV